MSAIPSAISVLCACLPGRSEKFERTVASGIAEAVVEEERADCALLAPAWLAALDMLESRDEPGAIVELPLKWGEVRREAKTMSEQGRKL